MSQIYKLTEYLWKFHCLLNERNNNKSRKKNICIRSQNHSKNLYLCDFEIVDASQNTDMMTRDVEIECFK